MKSDDKRIAHLKNLGRSEAIAIINLEKKLKKNSDFLEIAEITNSYTHMSKDGKLLSKNVCYVAGICGSREPKNEGDIGENVYKIVHFSSIVQRNGTWEHGGRVMGSNLQGIINYEPLRLNSD